MEKWLKVTTIIIIICCWYQRVKKRLHVPALITIWVAVPFFEIAMGVFSTDIINGVCVPFGVYSSVAMAKSMSFAIFLVAYLLPLALMIFCYSRIVYTLRVKVTQRRCICWYCLGLLSYLAVTLTSVRPGLGGGRWRQMRWCKLNETKCRSATSNNVVPNVAL